VVTRKPGKTKEENTRRHKKKQRKKKQDQIKEGKAIHKKIIRQYKDVDKTITGQGNQSHRQSQGKHTKARRDKRQNTGNCYSTKNSTELRITTYNLQHLTSNKKA
jgi:hypothetical protein